MTKRHLAQSLLGLAVLAALLVGTLFVTNQHSVQPQRDNLTTAEPDEDGSEPGPKPSDWFYRQRAYPYANIPIAEYERAQSEARKLRSAPREKSAQAVSWSEAGPVNIPGRITDIAVHPSQTNVIYAGSAAGGVFKSTNSGATWTAIFDDVGTQSIGAVAIHPTNPNILYVGTGESNSATDSYEGTGVYKTVDGGATWTFTGLPNSYHIGRIVIDPLRPESVYVAVLGRLFGTNPERGLYRSQNGGATWENLLYLNDSTGCVDVVLEPVTGTVMAAMWERWRNPNQRRVGGLSSGIFRSANFGATWTRLDNTNGLPAPATDGGRIGLALEPTTGFAYTVFIDHPGELVGIWWSPNLGLNWIPANTAGLAPALGGFGWYFGQIRVTPGDPLTVYLLTVFLIKSTDGGASWSTINGGIHVDHHALYVDPNNPDLLYNGCDGGVNLSTDGGSTWTPFSNMHNTQFYAITIDETNPDHILGGAQDNGTMRTLTGSLDNWDHILGGDGFYVLVDYLNPNIIYAEFQNGVFYKSVTGGNFFGQSLNGIDYSGERHNWSTPIAMDPNNPSVLYYGSDHLYRTTDAAANWTVISDDLTDGPHFGSNLGFGTLTTIDVAKTDGSVIYVGTDDANVWVTQNGGGTWTDISPGLPQRWVTRVTVDPTDAAVAYVALSGYKEGSQLSHIFRTTDYGQNWTSIQGDLLDAPVNDIIIDPHAQSTLFVGTDFGVFMTTNLGQNWTLIDEGMPLVPVHDLAFHTATRKLVAGTHGRSMYQTIVPCPGLVDDDGDGVMNQCDNCVAIFNPDQADSNRDGIGNVCDAAPCACPFQGDGDGNGFLDPLDLNIQIDILFFGAANLQDVNCPTFRFDLDCSGVTDPVDLNYMIELLFFTGPGPCAPCTP